MPHMWPCSTYFLGQLDILSIILHLRGIVGGFETFSLLYHGYFKRSFFLFGIYGSDSDQVHYIGVGEMPS